MANPLQVLVVEDSEDDTALLLRELQHTGFDVFHRRVDDADGLRDALGSHQWDIVLCDHIMPHLSSFEALDIIRDKHPDLPFIVISGKVGEEVAVKVMKSGADDFLLKKSLARLAPAIERELKDADLRQQREASKISQHQSEELFSRIFHVSPGLFSISDTADGVLYDVNRTWVETTGFSHAEAMAHSAVELGVWVDANLRKKYVRRLKKDGSVRDFEAKYRTKDGTVLDMLVDGEYVEIGGEPRLLIVSHDVTGRKIAEEQLRQAQKMEAVSRLSGGIAHDFNNLLAVVLGNLELLRDGIRSNEQLQLIEAGIAATQRGADLTRSMLSFARRARLEPMVFDLNNVVSDTKNWIGRTLPANIEVKTSLWPELWKVKADVSSTESALLNLFLNARDAMPDGGKLVIETGNVRIDENSGLDTKVEIDPGNYVMLAFADNGQGIEADVLGKIFEPFFTTKPPGSGSGLGLSMIEGFMKQSGGAVRVHSELGSGTTFKLFFRALTDSGSDQKLSAKSASTRKASKRRILVAEDQPDVRKLLELMLGKAGFEVSTARTGDEAKEMFIADPSFDLLLTDVVMPGSLQGNDLVRVLREIRNDLPVVFVSGHTSEATVQNNGSRPQDIRLTKPVLQSDLLGAIDMALSGQPTKT